MKLATILTILLASTLAFGQKFEVSDLSASDSPISFNGTAKVFKAGTTCMVAMQNNSSQSLLAVKITGEVTSPQGWMQSTGLSYDGFFKEAGILPGEDFDIVGPGFFDFISHERTYINGVEVKPQEPKKDLVCHAEFKTQFVQLADGSTWGDYEIQKNMMARRTKDMAILSHLVEAYETGGETAFDAALNEPESKEVAYRLKETAPYYKTTVIDLARKRLAAAQKRQASGIF